MQDPSSLRATDMFDLTGKVALVTGASSGLGWRFSQVLAANGAKVVCVARRRQKLDEVVSEIVTAGGTALAVEADVTDVEAMTSAFKQAEIAFGIPSVASRTSRFGCSSNGQVRQPRRSGWHPAPARLGCWPRHDGDCHRCRWGAIDRRSLEKCDHHGFSQRDTCHREASIPEEIDSCCLFLAYDEAFIVAGTGLIADGGGAADKLTSIAFRGEFQ